ncbi:MAG: NusG domain II-containing protein [Peptococcaceae bacterium]|jgi:hypothetical protein|nr:NusG domain II-containing protein [Peptococcaceae bacterium]
MMKKSDWLILAAALVLAGVLWLIRPLSFDIFAQRDAVLTVEISVEGRLWRSIPLDGAEYRERIETERGINDLAVDANGVAVVYADCPDQLCVRMGKITRPGDVLVCLPHQCVVELKSNLPAKSQEDSIDAISE